MCCFIKTASFDCCGRHYDLENGARLVARIGLGHGVLGFVAALFVAFLWACNVWVFSDVDSWYYYFWIVVLALQLAHLPMSSMLLRGISRRSSALVRSYLAVKMVWIVVNVVACFAFIVYGYILISGVKMLPEDPDHPAIVILTSKNITLRFLLSFVFLLASAIESSFWSVVYSYDVGGMQGEVRLIVETLEQGDHDEVDNEDQVKQDPSAANIKSN